MGRSRHGTAGPQGGKASLPTAGSESQTPRADVEPRESPSRARCRPERSVRANPWRTSARGGLWFPEIVVRKPDCAASNHHDFETGTVVGTPVAVVVSKPARGAASKRAGEMGPLRRGRLVFGRGQCGSPPGTPGEGGVRQFPACQGGVMGALLRGPVGPVSRVTARDGGGLPGRGRFFRLPLLETADIFYRRAVSPRGAPQGGARLSGRVRIDLPC